MSTITTESVISLWLDSDSDPSEPRWVVSRDTIDEAGGALTTDTLSSFDRRDLDLARREAIRLGRERGIRVIDTV